VIEAIGGFEESMRTVLEDQAFLAKMFIAAPAYAAANTWDRYRIHPHSACAVTERAGTFQQARLDYLDWLHQYVRQHRPSDRRLWRALRAEQLRCRLARRMPRLARLGRRMLAPRQQLRAAIPQPLKQKLRRLVRPLGGVRFGNLRRTEPVSRDFGFDRGQPIDRWYIEAFLTANAADVRGRVLEIGDDAYTRQFGGDRVSQRDVLHVDAANPKATIVDDLASGHLIPSASFDCVVLTQTLHLIYDLRAAVDTLHRILKPGGTLVMTVPGISQIDAGEWGSTWFWAFTPASIQRLFEERFPAHELSISSYGNVLAATAFLQGLAAEELSSAELSARDPLYPMVIGLRARKPM
jgi:SAM-dependent methyltransferase